jgi:hypothetical protein
MSKFIYLYRGPFKEMTPEQGAAWGSWMGQIGSALVDQGSPCGGGTVVVDDGSSAKISGITGYTIVEANDLNAATALTKGHPLLTDNKGLYSVEVLELIDMM